ncbi:serine hydrolase domain-containing protein [Sphingobacterium rhinopitheci]|uniref:serine hydrolase domain-containing protein n=1 Tax=Sphingobacterium rhinopitheci TaxID=2781960 RepID=UPI001F523624|nr:serine hydrolase [Sphingobacterium rhinopitheci]MCI0921425.1 serine hydrolase [Sphingobacterium rhinopitheci]
MTSTNLLNISLCCILSLFHTILFSQTIYPDKDWLKSTPDQLNINKESLKIIDSLMMMQPANGVLIRNGYIVAQWNHDGDENKKFETQSITKSVTSLILGVAIKEKKIKNIDEKVIKYYPDFQEGKYAKEITFRQLAQATSGLPVSHYKGVYLDSGNIKPGKESHYHNDHTLQLAAALTYIYGQPLNEILKSKVSDYLGIEVDWNISSKKIIKNGREIPLVHGYAFTSWTAKDLARLGWLFVQKGKWKNKQIITPEFVNETFTPITQPIYNFRKKSQQMEVMDWSTTYGLAWWGIRAKNDKTLWYMSGNGGQFCVVIPDEGIVFCKINGYSDQYLPYIRIDKFENALRNLVEK